MPWVTNTKKEDMYWAVGRPIVASGVMEEPGTTVTGLELFSGSSIDTFLEATKDAATGYKPLPDYGYVQAKEIYSYNKYLVIVLVTHNRDGRPPKECIGLLKIAPSVVATSGTS